VFVIGNSLAVSRKAEGAHKRYNLRVVECRLAAAMLANALGMPQVRTLFLGRALRCCRRTFFPHLQPLPLSQDFCRKVTTLQELEPVVAEKTGRSELAACAQAVKDNLHEATYTHDEVIA
jgi:N-acetylgalactosamine kinase